MTEVDKKREATASIRGYLYQIDATLKGIMNAEIDDQIVIEGIEDYDKYSGDDITYSQVKYYAGQNLTNSVLRDPLWKLFKHFIALDKSQQLTRKYVLYGFFAEVKIPIDQLTTERFKELMEFSENIQGSSGKKVRKPKSHLDGITVSDAVIGLFCAAFKIIIADEFSEHRASIVDVIRKTQNVSALEAEGFLYPRAFDYLATMAANSSHAERITTRRKLLEHLNGTIAVHRRWLLRENGKASYAKLIKRLYFSSLNSAGVTRVFIIEGDDTSDVGIVCDQLRDLARKWSSAHSNRMPDSERYAPYVMVRNVSEMTIGTIKDQLFDSGIEFVDGYPYRGSAFRDNHIKTAQTKWRKIALRFLDNESDLHQTLSNVGRTECRIYDFFHRKPMLIDLSASRTRMVSIPIEDIAMVKQVI